MTEAVHYKGEPIISDTRKVLMHESLQIPGLNLFGYNKIMNAETPLLPHYHQNMFEIHYITKGVFNFSAQSHDYKLTAGDLFITKPDEIHSSNLSPMSVGEFYWLLLDCTQTDHLLFLDQLTSQTMLKNLYAVRNHLIKPNTSEMCSLLKKAFQIALNTGNRHTVSAYLVLFLQLLLECDEQTRFSLTPDIGKSVDYIFNHLEEELRFEELAAACHLSVSQFKHKFKNQMGLSPRDFINRQKIELAKQLLLEDKSITDIAMELGFTTSGYFASVFKRYTTYSPAEYRQQKKWH